MKFTSGPIAPPVNLSKIEDGYELKLPIGIATVDPLR